MKNLLLAVATIALLSGCDAAGRTASLLAEQQPASAVAALRQGEAPLSPLEIHTIHAPYGIPAGAPATNDLIFRHSYTVSTNDTTRFADWVAYIVTPEWLEKLSDPERDYRTDHFLDDGETLEEISGAGDYEDAHAEHGYDRGHLVPLGSFVGSPFADELNYLSVLAPQVDRLNRGVWRSLENRVRRLVGATGEAYVLAGTLHERAQPMPSLPAADEDHLVPTAYWMVVYTGGIATSGSGEVSDSALRVAAFIVPQRLPDYNGPEDFLVSVDEVEAASGLDLLPLLPEGDQIIIEAAPAPEWFASW